MCVCLYIYIYTHTQTYVCVCVFAYLGLHMLMVICMNARMYACKYVRMNSYIHPCIHVSAQNPMREYCFKFKSKRV
jgi:hypothetical protein